jgi:hypothetical protein
VAIAGAFAAAPQSGLPWPRFPSPLIEPDVPISGIRLSDWLHPLIEPDVPISGIRLSDWLHLKAHGVVQGAR